MPTAEPPLGRQQGQATIEFALISMALLLLLVGVLDFGRAVYYYNVLSESARDGARVASLLQGNEWNLDGNRPGTYTSVDPYTDTTTILGAIRARAAGMNPNGYLVRIEAPARAQGIQLPVTVTIEYGYFPVAGAMPGIGPITVTAKSTMRIR